MARDAYGPAACIQSLLANIYRDQEKKPDPYMPADFLPGAKNSEEDDWRDFIEKVQSGYKFEVDPRQVAQFRAEMNRAFKDVDAPAPQTFTGKIQ